ncbi:xanthine dehydrogenase family protein molybdopterin-binding subunit [Pseudomonas sp. EA_35y_Pfl2_R5]|uniref:xanthine dehydrogenase family protein molybdopterin-binding subunit n=1 Tax=Pseudomonas sp. EA_35y_Pfl2_R5 TaxID=3088690 RepID=UPI0030D82881
MTSAMLGKPLDRVDGPLKVAGLARYAADQPAEALLHGSVVCSAIARGRIRAIDSSAALALPGVVLVMTHENRPPLAEDDESYEDDDAADGSPFRPLFNGRIRYSGQPVALVVADNLELSRYAASLVQVEYEAHSHQTDLQPLLDASHPAPAELPNNRGDADAAIAAADVRLDLSYELPNEYHNPMEPHASTVIYQADGKLLVHDKTQGPQNSQQYLASVLKLEPSKVRVLSSFVGGAFGSGLRPQYQLPLAAMAVLLLKRSVRVTLTRQQMFTFGYRPRTFQRLQLGAWRDGRLNGLVHEVIGQTSRFEDFTEHVAEWSGMLYHCDHLRLGYRLVPLDVYTPLDMRAPGGATGLFALESAMDELAWATDTDPVELRLINYSESNLNEGKPYSSKELRACYEQGAKAFGWERRSKQLRSMRRGEQLVGYGMATGVWEAMQMPASARATLTASGRIIVSSATCDIGPGTATAMTQIAAETLGLDPALVEFRLGDSDLPDAPLQGGSFTVSSVGSAVREACLALIERMCEAARQLADAPFSDARTLCCAGGRIQQGSDAQRGVELCALAARHGTLEAQVQAQPGKLREHFASATHSAAFVEVEVDEALGCVRVSRVVSAVAAGRVVNAKTARSQILGGVVWGVGMALHEEAKVDHTLGRCMNHNLAEYHIPVQADIGEIQVIFVDEDDQVVNSLGSKGVGEIGVVGVAAAVANAVYHATGKRIRQLPITLDKLLEP